MLKTDVELPRNLRQGFGLRPPMDLQAGKVLACEHHVRVLCEHLVHVGDVILAGDREEHAAAGEAQQLLLECAIRAAGIFAAQSDAVRAVFAQDPPPQRVVEIDDHALLGQASNGATVPHVLRREVSPLVGRDRRTSVEAHPLVVPARRAEARDQTGVVDHVHTLRVPAHRRERLIHAVHPLRLPPGELRVEDAQLAPARRGEVVHQDRGSAPTAQGLHQSTRFVADLPDAGVQARLVVVEELIVEHGSPVLPLHRQDHELGPKGVQPAVGIHDLLAELAEPSAVDLDGQPAQKTVHHERRLDKLDGKGGEERDLYRREGRTPAGGLLNLPPEKAQVLSAASAQQFSGRANGVVGVARRGRGAHRGSRLRAGLGTRRHSNRSPGSRVPHMRSARAARRPIAASAPPRWPHARRLAAATREAAS